MDVLHLHSGTERTVVMKKRSKIVTLFFFLVLGLGISSIAEEITLTTYYPAPYGAYEELRANKFTIGSTATMPTTDGEFTCEGEATLATSSGNVGIGTTEPAGTLVIDNDNSSSGRRPHFVIIPDTDHDVLTYSALFGNVGSIIAAPVFDGNSAPYHLWYNNGSALTVLDTWTTNSDFSEIYFNNGNVGIGTTGPNATLVVIGGVGVNRDVAVATGNIDISGWYLTNGADYAEYFEGEEVLGAGDIVGLNMETGKARKYQTGDEFIGIVSDNSGFVGNNVDDKTGYVLVGLVGQLEFDSNQVDIEERIVKTRDGKKVGLLLSNGMVFIR